MKLDRNLQLQILRELSEVYPQELWADRAEFPAAASEDLVPNLAYLHDHGLIDAEIKKRTSDGSLKPFRVTITARGMDFLADDGGLTAILGKVTVKLDADDLRLLLEHRVESADISASEKESIRHTIRTLPADALRAMVVRLTEMAVDQLPGAFQLLRTGGLQGA